MDSKGLACGILLFLLLMIVLGTKETNALHLESMDVHHEIHHGDDVARVPIQEKKRIKHVDDPRSSIFFWFEELKLGEKMNISFENEDSYPLSSPYLMRTKRQADAIPFSTKQLPEILQYFPFPPGSHKARVVQYTLEECETNPIKVEEKTCATSYEAVFDFARRILGFETEIKVLLTAIKHPTSATDPAGNGGGFRMEEYEVVQLPQRIRASTMVFCHAITYPYTVVNCHSQVRGKLMDNRIYRVVLRGGNGENVEAVAICHMNTAHWNTDNVAFQVLGIQPGTAPVCHFVPTDSFVLVPSAATTTSSA